VYAVVCCVLGGGWCGCCGLLVVFPVVVVWDEHVCLGVYFAYGCAGVGWVAVLVSVGCEDFEYVLVFACFACDYSFFW